MGPNEDWIKKTILITYTMFICLRKLFCTQTKNSFVWSMLSKRWQNPGTLTCSAKTVQSHHEAVVLVGKNRTESAPPPGYRTSLYERPFIYKKQLIYASLCPFSYYSNVESAFPGENGVVWFGSSPPPPPPASPVSKLSLFLNLPVRCRSSFLTERGVGVGEEPNHSTARKPGSL